MKRGFWILLIALLAGVIGFFATRRPCFCAIGANSLVHDGGSMLPELKWLRAELSLTDVQFDKVAELHLAYRPTCEALCEKVVASRKKVRTLASTGDIASRELEAALQEQAAVQVECQRAMLKHLHQTAAVMSPQQARQYLDAMLPQVLGAEAGHMPEGH
jgi:Spy/CpxP family protein refolding chaperone